MVEGVRRGILAIVRFGQMWITMVDSVLISKNLDVLEFKLPSPPLGQQGCQGAASA